MFEMTLKELSIIHLCELNRLVDEAGSAPHLAKMLATPLSTVKAWIKRGRISKAGARTVESHPTLGRTFIATDLRPELTK